MARQMGETVPNLRLVDGALSERGLASEFHQVNRVLPKDQDLLRLEPRRPVRDAMAELRDREYSQAPVISNGIVIGVFSFRAFAEEVGELALLEWNQRRCAPGDLEVRDCLEDFQFARVTDELSSVFDALDRDNGVLVGAPDRLIGILTPMDVLRYFHEIASPFVLMSEIEIALRRLIKDALSDEAIAEAAKECLADAYNNRDVPTTLEAMTLGDYESLIGFGKTWPSFQHVFGSNRIHTKTRLAEIGGIRNDLFHFRQRMEPKIRRQLSMHRNWCLARMKMLEAQGRKEQSK
jgi:predicted transcriptional regulator